MFGLTPETRVFIKTGATDGRYGMEALRGLVAREIRQDLKSGALFCFANRARNRIRLLWADQNGLFLATKRLEQGQFNDFPRDGTAVKAMTFPQLQALVSGVRFTKLPSDGQLSNGGYRR